MITLWRIKTLTNLLHLSLDLWTNKFQLYFARYIFLHFLLTMNKSDTPTEMELHTKYSMFQKMLGMQFTHTPTPSQRPKKKIIEKPTYFPTTTNSVTCKKLPFGFHQGPFQKHQKMTPTSPTKLLYECPPPRDKFSPPRSCGKKKQFFENVDADEISLEQNQFSAKKVVSHFRIHHEKLLGSGSYRWFFSLKLLKFYTFFCGMLSQRLNVNRP